MKVSDLLTDKYLHIDIKTSPQAVGSHDTVLAQSRIIHSTPPKSGLICTPSAPSAWPTEKDDASSERSPLPTRSRHSKTKSDGHFAFSAFLRSRGAEDDGLITAVRVES